VPTLISNTSGQNVKVPLYLGSGSNFLSNEIMYRIALQRERWLKQNPQVMEFSTGHFHVAFVQSLIDTHSSEYGIFSRTIYIELTKLISTVKNQIINGANNLTPKFKNES
jgi:hypothetical protein